MFMKNRISLMPINKSINFILLSVLFVFGVLSSCATGSTIVTGTKRPAINPSEVYIYLDPPAEYENIGIIETSSDVGFSRQKAQDRAIKNMKSKAAKIGANGILLTHSGSQAGGSGGFYSNGFYYGGSSEKIHAQGRAIFVIKK